MINSKQKKEIIRVLGHRYVAPIKAELNNLGIVNTKGEPHSSSMITNVMNGLRHDEIEGAIFSLLEKKALELKKRNQTLKELPV